MITVSILAVELALPLGSAPDPIPSLAPGLLLMLGSVLPPGTGTPLTHENLATIESMYAMEPLQREV